VIVRYFLGELSQSSWAVDPVEEVLPEPGWGKGRRRGQAREWLGRAGKEAAVGGGRTTRRRGRRRPRAAVEAGVGGGACGEYDVRRGERTSGGRRADGTTARSPPAASGGGGRWRRRCVRRMRREAQGEDNAKRGEKMVFFSRGARAWWGRRGSPRKPNVKGPSP
jgi:hypothetical protein